MHSAYQGLVLLSLSIRNPTPNDMSRKHGAFNCKLNLGVALRLMVGYSQERSVKHSLQ